MVEDRIELSNRAYETHVLPLHHSTTLLAGKVRVLSEVLFISNPCVPYDCFLIKLLCHIFLYKILVFKFRYLLTIVNKYLIIQLIVGFDLL